MAPYNLTAKNKSPITSFSATLYRTLEESNGSDKHWYYFLAVDFSPDGKLLVTGDNNGFVRLWDVATGSPLQWTTARYVNTSGEHYTASIESLTFAPDGNCIWVTDGQNGVWDWPFKFKTGSTYPDSQRMPGLGGKHIALSADGKLLAASGQIWYLPTRARLGNFAGGGPVAISPSNDFVASLSYKSSNTSSPIPADTIAIWKTGDCTKVIEKSTNSAAINSIQFSPDGQTVATGSDDRTVRFWNWNGGSPVLRGIIFDDAKIHCIAFSPNGRLVAVASGDVRKIWVHDTVSFSTKAEFNGYFLAGHGVAFSPDSTLLAMTVNESDSYRNNYRVKIWRLSYT